MKKLLTFLRQFVCRHQWKHMKTKRYYELVEYDKDRRYWLKDFFNLKRYKCKKCGKVKEVWKNAGRNY